MKLKPTTANVTLWLNHMNREQLHEQGWVEVNRRFHGIARAARPFLQEFFPNEQDQEAAFDGLTLALLAVGHFDDIERLANLFAEAATPADQRPQLADDVAKPQKSEAE